MKQMKKLLCGLLMVCMVLTGIGIMPQTVQAKTASGNDGEIHWEIKGDTLTLSAVKGTKGRMNNYGHYWDERTQQSIEYPDAPWEKSSSMKNVKNIILKNGITSLGNMAFTYNTSVQKMTIAGTVKKIPSTFCWDAKIDSVVFYDGDGYSSSAAYNFVKKYNKLATETYQNGWSSEGGGIWVILDKNGNESKAIKFHKLNASSIFSKAKAPSAFSVNKGKSKALKITLPAGLTQVAKYTGSPADVKATFKSSNSKVATVSSSGKVTGKKKGTAKISISMQIKNGAKKTLTTKVIVK